MINGDGGWEKRKEVECDSMRIQAIAVRGEKTHQPLAIKREQANCLGIKNSQGIKINWSWLLCDTSEKKCP